MSPSATDYTTFPVALDGCVRDIVPLTASDTVPTVPTVMYRGLYTSLGGDIAIVTFTGQQRILPATPVGSWHPIIFSQLLVTGTTNPTGIVGGLT